MTVGVGVKMVVFCVGAAVVVPVILEIQNENKPLFAETAKILWTLALLTQITYQKLDETEWVSDRLGKEVEKGH